MSIFGLKDQSIANMCYSWTAINRGMIWHSLGSVLCHFPRQLGMQVTIVNNLNTSLSAPISGEGTIQDTMSCITCSGCFKSEAGQKYLFEVNTKAPARLDAHRRLIASLTDILSKAQ